MIQAQGGVIVLQMLLIASILCLSSECSWGSPKPYSVHSLVNNIHQLPRQLPQSDYRDLVDAMLGEDVDDNDHRRGDLMFALARSKDWTRFLDFFCACTQLTGESEPAAPDRWLDAAALAIAGIKGKQLEIAREQFLRMERFAHPSASRELLCLQFGVRKYQFTGSRAWLDLPSSTSDSNNRNSLIGPIDLSLVFRSQYRFPRVRKWVRTLLPYKHSITTSPSSCPSAALLVLSLLHAIVADSSSVRSLRDISAHVNQSNSPCTSSDTELELLAVAAIVDKHTSREAQYSAALTSLLEFQAGPAASLTLSLLASNPQVVDTHSSRAASSRAASHSDSSRAASRADSDSEFGLVGSVDREGLRLLLTLVCSLDARSLQAVRGAVGSISGCTDGSNIAHMLRERSSSINPDMPAKVLVVGDGDLSFCSALSKELELGGSAGASRLQLTCSTLDAKQTLLRKYSSAQENIRKLEESSCVLNVVFGVDAHNFSSVDLDFVIFNFPYADVLSPQAQGTGEDSSPGEARPFRTHWVSTERHRELLRGLLRSSSSSPLVTSGHRPPLVVVTVLLSQALLWSIVELADSCGWELQALLDFSADTHQTFGYCLRRTNVNAAFQETNSDGTMSLLNAWSFVFRKR